MDWKFLLGVIGPLVVWLWSVYTWRKNQDVQRAQNEYQRKDQLYREMLKSISTFYKGASPSVGVAQFLEQYRLAWHYAPDDVIGAVGGFLDTQKADIPAVQKNTLGQQALAELVASVRKDQFTTAKLITTLRASDFKHHNG
jgi:hypothetical protein